MEILYEDKNIIVCVKPAGTPSQADKSGDEDMTEILKGHTGGSIYAVHRLDRNVGGVMAFAKTKQSAAYLTREIAQGGFLKEYIAVLCGKADKGGQLCDYILKNGRLNISKIVNKNSAGSKEARLCYEPLRYAEKDKKILTLARITLYTGRHHQIRVQMANAGFPLYADTKYNPEFLRKRTTEQIGLWADTLTLALPETNEKRTFAAEPRGGIFEFFYK